MIQDLNSFKHTNQNVSENPMSIGSSFGINNNEAFRFNVTDFSFNIPTAFQTQSSKFSVDIGAEDLLINLQDDTFEISNITYLQQPFQLQWQQYSLEKINKQNLGINFVTKIDSSTWVNFALDTTNLITNILQSVFTVNSTTNVSANGDQGSSDSDATAFAIAKGVINIAGSASNMFLARENFLQEEAMINKQIEALNESIDAMKQQLQEMKEGKEFGQRRLQKATAVNGGSNLIKR